MQYTLPITSAYPDKQPVHRLFEVQVDRMPDKVAVVFPPLLGGTTSRHLTYRELNRRANHLAHHLQSLGIGPDVLVGLFVEPSLDMIIGMLATLKAGGAYLPLDIVYPQERLAFMLQDGHVPVLLTQQHLRHQLPQHDCLVICLDSDWETSTYKCDENPVSAATADNLIYVMYTSGSIGIPKGVAIPHGAVSGLVCDQNYIQLTSTDIIGQASNVSFDAATFEIWGALLHGATLVGIKKDTALSPKLLAAYLREQQISVLFLTTALFNQIAGEVPDAFSSLRYLLFGGEAVTPRWVAEVLKNGVPDNLLHVYGPTESTTFATWYRVKDVPEGATTIPIGRPIANTIVYVLDDNGQPVPAGTPGELYIGGAGLARGYLNRADLTAARFINDPWSDDPCARLYQTGDLVRCLPDGNIEFLGRMDHQVKIRGFRIELAEIETTLAQHPAVHQVIVIVREDQPGDKRIVAYIVPTSGQTPAAHKLRSMLKAKLPEYMIPQAFVCLEALPLTANGKVDRRALPEPDVSSQVSTDVVAPRTSIEAVLARIWTDVLKQQPIGIHDNFFDLGGHSLLVVQVVARVGHELQVDLPINQFFASPTIAEQAQLIERAAEEQGRRQAPPIQVVAHQEPLLLSFPQRQLWFFDQLHPSEPVYNETIVLHMREEIDTIVLEQALNALIARHEMLRTTFTTAQDQPMQVIHAPKSLYVRNVDLSKAPVAERETAGHQLATAELKARFDLEHGPLLRATLVKLSEADWRLYLSAHHIILDGISMYSIFLPELEALYRALLAGQPSPLPELSIQYADFAVWQHQWFTDDVLSAQLDYWKQKLADLPSLQLSTDRPYAAKTTYRGARQCLSLSKELTGQLKTLSRQEGVTLFVTLVAAVNTLLYRYTGQEDLVIGTVHSGRGRLEVQGVMGNFLNNLVLRTDVSGDPSFRELLPRVKQVLSEAYQHPDVPFEKLVAALQPERMARQNPLFQVAFVMEPPLPAQNLRWNLSQLDIHSETAKFDLLIELDERPGGIIGRIEYSSDLFDDATITRMIGHFQVLLEGVVANPTQPISKVSLLTEAERRMLMSWNNSADDPQDACLHHLFTAQVERTPNAVAVVCDGSQLTYTELNLRANQLAHYLRRHGVGPETLVALYLERSADMIVAILAVLKAGGGYLPIDLTYPPERVAFMLEDAKPAVLLTQHEMKRAEDGAIASQSSHLLLSSSLTTVHLDAQWPEIAQEPATDPAVGMTSASLAYVIYTSGSTGKPKGCMVTHANVVRLFTATDEWYGFTECDVWTLFHSYAFDFSVWEIWGALLYGGRLVVVPFWLSRSPEQFYQLLQAEGVTVLNQTPSAFRQLIHAEEALGTAPDLALRYIIFGGEALEFQSLRPWFERHGDQRPRLVNMYGITETTVHVTYRPLSWADLEHTMGSAIGVPIPALTLYVLDQHRQPVPVGVPGELYVGGAGLARGYLNRPELTAECFIDWTVDGEQWTVEHPTMHRPSPTVRLYKTGDRVRLLAGGDMEYLGRIDQQVKIRGFRIELGEVEALLAQHPTVAEAAVIVREDTPGDKRLVAYIVPVQKPETENQEPGEAAADGSRFSVRDPLPGAQLRRYLASRLPDYMLPADFVALERLPLTTNGKLDRRALPAPDPARSLRSSIFVAAQTETERLLADVWAAVLGIEQVGIHDNFFELGGDSMRAIQALAKANQHGLALSLPQLFEQQTIHALAKLCHPDQPAVDAAKSAAFSLISEADRQKLPDDVEDAYPLSVLQAGMIYHTEYEPGTDVYHDLMGSRIYLPLALDSLRDALQELVRRHPMLRTSVALAGFSESLQLVHRDIAVPLTVEDLQHLSFAEQEQAIDAWFAIEKRRAFDWHTPPLFCVRLHQRGPACFNLTLSFHHIILEGWSIATLLTELFQLYLAALGRETRPLAPPPASLFRDFVAIERRVIQSEAARHYWVQKFADKPLTRLPRWPESYRSGGQPGVLEIRVSTEVSDRLKQLAQTAQVPFKSVLLAAHLRMLRLHCNQAGVTTGLVTNIRPEAPDADRVLGLYLNTLPFYLDLPGGSWIDLVRATFKAEQADIAFREYPLAEIQRNLGRPLFETIFNIVHFHVYQDLLGQEGLDGINEKVFQRTNFPLLTSFVLNPRSAQLERLVIDYDGSEICYEQVKAVGDSYLGILEAMATQPEARYETQTLLPASMWPIVEGNRNNSAIAGIQESCIHTLFEAQVERTPDAIALAFHSLRCASSLETHLTYRELNCRANQLAHHLKQLGVGPETLVGLCVDRSPDMVVGLLGILKAGGAYVPFDPSHPQARLAFMLQDAQIKVLVTQATLIERLPEYNGALVRLDTERSMIARLPQENPVVSVEAANLAYVLYTSGSTGRPKGVAIEHRQTTNLLYWARDTFRPEELRGVLAATSLNFDLSVFEIFASLSWGGKVIVAENMLHLPYLADREEITLINTVPSTMTELVIDRIPASVHVVNVAGEPLRDALVQQIYAQQAIDKVFNLYGPTEATTYSTFALMQKGQHDPMTIGRPIRATEVYILDDHLQPVPIGVPGELYLGGAGLARGYVQHPELTGEKFIAHPFSAEPGARLYKTGDLARYLPDCKIEYLGRVDHQVKIRGFRIEPGEIEAVLIQHPAIRNAVVIAREDTPGAKYLVAYLVTDEVQQVTIGELRRTLHLHLPDYMVPAYYMMLDKLPLNAHGKVDRQALPTPDRRQGVAKAVYVAPWTLCEQQLARIWADLLGIEEVGIHDNFFELGGHSILGMEMIARARYRGLELTIKQLFQTPTIAALAQAAHVELEEYHTRSR